jgi:GntR family transcriptional regulator
MIMKFNTIIPLYYQIAKLLEFKIIKGEFPPLSIFPSESELCQSLKVSRITIRQSLAYLSSKGFLIRRKGRKTIVTDKGFQEETLELKAGVETVGFSKLGGGTLYDKSERIKLKVVSLSKTKAPEWIRRHFNIFKDEDVYLFKRIRFRKNEPIAYVKGYLRKDIGEYLKKQDLLKFSMINLAQNRFGLKVYSLEQAIEVYVADKEIAQALEMNISDPVMHLTSVISISKKDVVQIHEAFFKPGRVSYRVKFIAEES